MQERHQGLDLGGEPELGRTNYIVDGLDTEPVARKEQCPRMAIEDGHAPHAVEPVQAILTPAIVGCQDDFGVRLGSELVATALEFFA